ncbi:MAG: hypothetical protein ACOCZM_01265 [Bacillota bacterium]
MKENRNTGVMDRAGILDRGVMILRKNLRKFMLYSLASGLIILLVTIGFVLVVMVLLSVLPKEVGVFVLILALILFVGLIMCFNVGMIHISACDFLDRKIDISGAIKISLNSFTRVVKLLLALILYSIPALLVIGLLGYFLYSLLGGINFQSPGVNGFRILLVIVLGFAGYVGLMSYISLFCFSFHTAFIGRKRKTFSAIRRSIQMVRRNFRELLGMFLLVLFIPAAINGSLEGLAGIVSSLIYLLMRLINSDLGFFTILPGVYNVMRFPVLIINALVTSNLAIIFLTVLYFNRRFVDEGYDLSQRLSWLRA